MNFYMILILILTGMILAELVSRLLAKSSRKASPKGTQRVYKKGESRNAVVSARDKRNLPEKPGIYLICENGQYEKPLYIGSAINIKNRFKNHSTFKEIINDFGKDAIEITWVGCDEKSLGKVEQSLISKFKPPYNRAMIVTR